MATYRAGSGSYQQVLSATINPSSIPANSIASETFNPSAWSAITSDSWCMVQMPSLEAGVVILNSYISATGTVTIWFENATGSAIDPASQTAQLLVF